MPATSARQIDGESHAHTHRQTDRHTQCSRQSGCDLENCKCTWLAIFPNLTRTAYFIQQQNPNPAIFLTQVLRAYAQMQRLVVSPLEVL